ncbi:hypothetical protein Q8W15_13880 [Photobacterium damselae subsp. piscicida]|nr:hypothetical protein [Photobacterium damselae subsp. piscicida]BDR34648.1 hypothetical protein PDY_16960 [Photobacterium damselae subsp. damselae]
MKNVLSSGATYQVALDLKMFKYVEYLSRDLLNLIGSHFGTNQNELPTTSN